jgi:eukaryotic-like serine/threonine-protein kinase
MTQSIQFPGVMDYFKAVQFPKKTFTVASLQTAQFEQDTFGPRLARGASAVVFTANVGGNRQAVRCYIRDDASSQERYRRLDEYLADHDLNPYVSPAMWLDSAIKVNGATWPVLQMVWIEGRTLNEYVNYLVTKTNMSALTMLAANWRELVRLMQSVEFAHGDLQHGNILIDQAGTLRLVDYDGVWIPQLARMAPPTEYGQANYQHPGTQEWGRWFDTFSALVIYLCLVALGKNPELWPVLYNGTNLLFTSTDFQRPNETPAWQQLAALRDAEVDELARRLRDCCDPGWRADKSLERTIEVTTATSTSPVPGVQEWWQKPSVTWQKPPATSGWPFSQPSTSPHPTPSTWPGGRPTLPGVSMPTGASLPAPPPLNTGGGLRPPPSQPQAPAETWWKQAPSSSPPTQGPASSQSASSQSASSRSTTPVPAASTQVPRKSLGALAVGLCVLLLIIGAAEHIAASTWTGLVLGAVGVWLLISGSGSSGSGSSGTGRPGSTGGSASASGTAWYNQKPPGQT